MTCRFARAWSRDDVSVAVADEEVGKADEIAPFAVQVQRDAEAGLVDRGDAGRDGREGLALLGFGVQACEILHAGEAVPMSRLVARAEPGEEVVEFRARRLLHATMAQGGAAGAL